MINTRKIFFVPVCEIFVYFFLLSIPQQGTNWWHTKRNKDFMQCLQFSKGIEIVNMSHVDMICYEMLETVIMLCRHICISSHRTQFILMRLKNCVIMKHKQYSCHFQARSKERCGMEKFVEHSCILEAQANNLSRFYSYIKMFLCQ